MASTWIEQKIILCKLVKKLSDFNGGDDIDWLKDYCKDLLEVYRSDLSVPIACFTDLLVNHRFD